MKRFILIIAALLLFSATAHATWTLTPSIVARSGHYLKWKVVCTSDGNALTATDILAQTSDNYFLRQVQGSTLMIMKVSPGTGGVIPNATINIDLEDEENDDLWADTAISKDAISWHDLSADISQYPPVLINLYLVMNDIGDSGDQVTLYFINWIE